MGSTKQLKGGKFQFKKKDGTWSKTHFATKGAAMAVWNFLMAISLLGALAAAATAIYDKVTDTKNATAIWGGRVVLAVLVVYLLLVAAGFLFQKKAGTAKSADAAT